MASPAPILKLVNISKRYESPDGAAPLPVLSGVSLELSRGESLAIVGPSGSGKSTLLQIMGTLDRPTTGEVTLNGQELNRLNDNQLAAVRNRELGFVFQAHYLLPQCTVLENVLVPTLALRRAGPSSDPERKVEPAADRATRLLTHVGLADRLSHRPGQLSGGERQRVALVRALINQPQLLLADEPTGSLDHASAQKLAQLLLELNREEGVTLILVTHARDLARLMSRVLRLSDGSLAPNEDGG
jgi:ABC-type lipoprotein export system ATPase subunit